MNTLPVRIKKKAFAKKTNSRFYWKVICQRRGAACCDAIEKTLSYREEVILP